MMVFHLFVIRCFTYVFHESKHYLLLQNVRRVIVHRSKLYVVFNRINKYTNVVMYIIH